MMKRLAFTLVLLFFAAAAHAQVANQMVTISSNGKYLVNTMGATPIPVFLTGDAPQTITTMLNATDPVTYLNDRQSRGFNSLWFLVTDQFDQTTPPKDFFGNAPFTGAWFSATENPAYWANVDLVVTEAQARGMIVFLMPSFVGIVGHGFDYNNYLSSSDATMTAYGTFIGNRYKNFNNIVYVLGGDANLGSGIGPKVTDIANGILAADTNHLLTLEGCRACGGPNNQTSMDAFTSAGLSVPSWLTLDWEYPQGLITTTPVPIAGCQTAYTQSLSGAKQPPLMGEDWYELEQGETSAGVRQEGYWEILSGCYLGRLFGNGAIWSFNGPGGGLPTPTWQSQLGSVASVGQQNLGKLFRSREHWLLVPDISHTYLTAGASSGASSNVLARTSDGQTMIAYVSTGSSTPITVNMAGISSATSTAKAWWFNPATAAVTTIGTFANTGTRVFTAPDGNDWVLVLDDNSITPLAPGSNCQGSGTAYFCNPGTTSAELVSVIGAATTGAVTNFSPTFGLPYSFTSFTQFNPAKGMTFICSATPSAVGPQWGASQTTPCVINFGANNVFGGTGFSGATPNTNLYRISGFTFDTRGTCPGSQGIITFDNSNGSNPVDVEDIRIDHNSIINAGSGCDVYFGGFGSTQGMFNGVIDHNFFHGAHQGPLFWAIGSANVSPPAMQLGTIHNMFLEDNYVQFDAMTPGDLSAIGCVDSWGSNGAFVARHNTSVNCLWTAHGVTHGGGPPNIEFYNNNVTLNSGATAFMDCNECTHWQGSGTFIFANNIFTPVSGQGHSTNAIQMQEYRAYAGNAGEPDAVTQIAVSGSALTVTGTFPACGSNACTGFPWVLIQGMTNAGNNVWFKITGSSTTTLTGTASTQVNETHAGSKYTGSVDGDAPQCDGSIAGIGGFTDQNRAPLATWRGYPCWNSPGRVFGSQPQALVPIPSWNNTWSDLPGTAIVLDYVNNNADHPFAYFLNHVQPNRDYYNAVSSSAQSNSTTPFNGTVGMGFGTLANRPTTCTTNATEAGTGVEYFAQDVGTQGTLYICSAANTWTSLWQPFTYPHPLVSGVAVPGVSFNPTSISFGSLAVGVVSAPQTITVTNTGTANLTWTNFFTVQPGGTVFNDTAGGGTCPTANVSGLAPGASCTVVVTGVTNSLGLQSGNFSLPSNAGTALVPLSITGVNTASPAVGMFAGNLKASGNVKGN